MAGKLSVAAAASLERTTKNGFAIDNGKTEAALFHKKRTAPTAKIEVGDKEIPFSTEATCWLGVWLDSQLTVKEHHTIRLKKGRYTMSLLRRLLGRMDFSVANCRKVMTACVQSVAIFGAELWCGVSQVYGSIGRAADFGQSGS